MPVLASWPEVVLMTFSTKTDVMDEDKLQYIYFFLIFIVFNFHVFNHLSVKFLHIPANFLSRKKFENLKYFRCFGDRRNRFSNYYQRITMFIIIKTFINLWLLNHECYYYLSKKTFISASSLWGMTQSYFLEISREFM